MREILFRGKRLDNGEWVEGSLTLFNKTVTYTEITYQHEFEEGKFYIVRADVDPSTVGQYTGLKDKHGKRIFEGDIVVFSRGRNLPNSACLPELIKYHQGDCAYQRYPLGRCVDRGGGGRLIQPDMMVSCELFGNVHDNPELLDASRCLECLKGAKNKSCLIYKEGCSCGTQDDIKCLQQPAE